MFKAGLVLEGGGMKGVYTAGVLDFFLDKDVEFSSVYGVSAGACCMASYIAKQKGRGKDVMVDYLGDKRYLGLYSLLTTGNIFGVDFTYNLVPNYLNPIDVEAYKKYEGKAYAVLTNIKTGKAEYHEVKDPIKDVDIIRASSSLPLVAQAVEINGETYMDGGIADSIPICKSEADGNFKNVVVLTKPAGYQKKPELATLPLLKTRYFKYPAVYSLMKERHNMYNKTMAYIESKEALGNLLVIRPSVDLDISRMEKDPEKLNALYEAGYKDAQNKYNEMIDYLYK